MRCLPISFAVCQIRAPKKASHSVHAKKSGPNVDEIDPKSHDGWPLTGPHYLSYPNLPEKESSINDVTTIGGGSQGFCDNNTKAFA